MRSQNERRFVTGVAIFQATAQNVEHTRKNGYEQGFRILPRDFCVGFTEQFIDAAPTSKGGTLAKSFADRHEYARGQAFPGNIAHEKEQVFGIEHEEVV
jgi:hypothetical protein